jgi:hypothetical protein
MAVRRRVDCFPGGHPGYGDWLAEHPLGYVLTHRGHDDAAILHRADCLHVSSPRQKFPRIRAVSPGYFRVIGVTLTRGHWPVEGESLDVVLVNQSLAWKTVGRGQDIVGRHLRGSFLNATIAGVVADFRDWQLDEAPKPQAYMAMRRDARRRAGGSERCRIRAPGWETRESDPTAHLIGREPITRMSTSLLALCCRSGLAATLATPIRALSRSMGSRSLRISPLFIARFTRARIASQTCA